MTLKQTLNPIWFKIYLIVILESVFDISNTWKIKILKC